MSEQQQINWSEAPHRTAWGDGIVVADIAITPDTTATIFCEARDIARVTEILLAGLREAEKCAA